MKTRIIVFVALCTCGFWIAMLAVLTWIRPSKQAQLDCAYSEAIIQGEEEEAHRLLVQGASPRGVCVVQLPVHQWTWGTTYYVRSDRTVREEKRLWRGKRTVLKDGEDW